MEYWGRGRGGTFCSLSNNCLIENISDIIPTLMQQTFYFPLKQIIIQYSFWLWIDYFYPFPSCSSSLLWNWIFSFYRSHKMFHLHARSNNELNEYWHFTLSLSKAKIPPRPSQTSSFACYLVPSFVVIGQALDRVPIRLPAASGLGNQTRQTPSWPIAPYTAPTFLNWRKSSKYDFS